MTVRSERDKMSRLVKFAGGLLSGGAIGTVLGLLLTPESGDAMRAGLRTRYQNALAVGRAAGELKRLELEAEFKQLTGVALSDSAPATPEESRAAPGARTG